MRWYDDDNADHEIHFLWHPSTEDKNDSMPRRSNECMLFCADTTERLFAMVAVLFTRSFTSTPYDATLNLYENHALRAGMHRVRAGSSGGKGS